MKIGEVAKRSGVQAETIRYYENVGLISQVARGINGYRHYSNSDVETLRFIKSARSLGFSVEDISRLLELWRNKRRSSAQVKELASRQVTRIEHKIGELESMRLALEKLIMQCQGDSRPECPILEELGKLNIDQAYSDARRTNKGEVQSSADPFAPKESLT